MGLLAAVLRREGPAVPRGQADALPQPHQRAVTPQGRGRYPGFDVLDRWTLWDDVTAGVVLARLALPGELAFFTPAEVGVAGPLLDLLLAQDADPRVPVLALIDARLAAGETDGWHYDDMPEDAQAWRDTLRLLDQDAQQRHHGRGFAHLISDEQAALIQAVQDLSRRRELARLAGDPRVEPMDPVRLHRVLLPPLGLERDRLPRPGLPPRLPEPRRRRPRTLGGRRRGTEDATPTRSPSPTASSTPAASTSRHSAGQLGVRSDYRAIRARNESAWLLPNDGTPHQPPAARRHAPLRRRRRGRPRHRGRRRRRQRPDPAAGPRRLAGRVPRRRTVLGPRRRLGQRRTRLAHPVLDRTAPDRRRRPGAARLEQLRPRRRRLDGALRRLHPPLPPLRLPHLHSRTGSAPTGPSTTPT